MPAKNEPKCKECFDEGCKSCIGDDMPECPECNTNKYVDVMAADQAVFCCVKCGTEFVEDSNVDEDEEDADKALNDAAILHWDRIVGKTKEKATDKPEFGKVVDDTDPDNLREL